MNQNTNTKQVPEKKDFPELERHEDRIRKCYLSSLKLAEELGMDQKQAFWAHITLWASPDLCDINVNVNNEL